MVMLRALFYTIVRFTAICLLFSAVDGRHTRRSSIAVRAAGGRCTMINTMKTQSLYLTMVLQEGRKGLTKRVHLY